MATPSEPGPAAGRAARVQAMLIPLRARVAWTTVRWRAVAGDLPPEPPAWAADPEIGSALARDYGLDATDLALLLLVVGARVDPETAAVIDAAGGMASGGGVRLRILERSLAADIGGVLEMGQRLGRAAPLVARGLLAVSRSLVDSGDVEVRATELGISALLGTPQPEGEASAPDTPDAIVAPAVAVELLGKLSGLVEAPAPATVALITGPAGAGRTLAAQTIAAMARCPLLRVDLAGWLAAVRAGEPARRWFDDAARSGAVLLFDDLAGAFAEGGVPTELAAGVLAGLADHAGVVVFTAHEASEAGPALLARVHVRVELPAPDAPARRLLWERALAGRLALDGATLDTLARRYELSGARVQTATLAAARLAGGEPTLETVEQAAQMQLRRGAGPEVPAAGRLGLADLIAPDEVRAQVGAVLAACRSRARVLGEWGFGRRFSRGLGISALFHGQPGTGKTLAAEILASELGLALHRVNVAQVIDKYVGETEKNLVRIFQEARSEGSLLLFDEADALFSSRVQVEHSQDRFANLEINLLLQLVESFEGICVLTTNLPQGIDQAFERRIRYRVAFPFPDASLRGAIWRHLVPSETPVAEDVDWDELAARFELSGGSIQSAILRAAYACAAQDGPLDMAALEDAAEKECMAAGKLFRPRVAVSDPFGM